MPDQLALLMNQLGRLQDRLSELEHRHERQLRFGTTEQVDGKNHKVRMRIGGTEDKPMLSPWTRYSQQAGHRRHHSMPSGPDQQQGQQKKTKGQQLLLISLDGNPEQSLAVPLGWSNDQPAPSNDPEKDVDQRHNPSDQKNKDARSVWWQTAGSVQQQVNGSSWHVSKANARHRVGDNRDGTDSLDQELNPKNQDKKDKVHYHDLDSNGDEGGNGLTHSVLNDTHRVNIHPKNGWKQSVNLKPTDQSTPGPDGDNSAQSTTHFHQLDAKNNKSIISVYNGDHTTTHDSSGIAHKTKGAHTVNGKSSSVTATDSHSVTAPTISDTATTIAHNGNTSVTGNLGVTKALSALTGHFGTGSFDIAEDGSFEATSGGSVTGGFAVDAFAASVPLTKTGTSYAQGVTDFSLIFNPSGTFSLTLLSAATYPGRVLLVKCIAAFAVNSVSSNVVPLTTATAGTAILSGAGKWAVLQSDGSHWIVMAGN